MFIKNKDLDIKRSFTIVEERKSLINKTSNKAIPSTYKVNEVAKALHPGFIKAKVSKIERCTSNSKVITFKSLSKNKRFPYFRSGSYISLTKKINESLISRPYSIYSSPKEALKGILKIAVQDAGFFSHELNHNLKVGNQVIISEPSGDFYYDSIRDKKHILAIAGGSGVTPFISMIKAIKEGSEDFKLTLIYGVKTRKDLMYDFSKIKDSRIKVIVVLSNEKVKGYEYGFISKDILKKYMPKECSIFMCGPDVMYGFVKKELTQLGINEYLIRQEHNCVRDLKMEHPRKFKLTVHMRNKIYHILALENESILVAMEKASLCVSSKCRSGRCGFCHTRIIKGNYITNKTALRLADIKFNYVHACATFPTSNMEIDIPVQDDLKEIL